MVALGGVLRVAPVECVVPIIRRLDWIVTLEVIILIVTRKFDRTRRGLAFPGWIASNGNPPRFNGAQR